MLTLALDTTTRSGSLALVRDGGLLAQLEGDPARTHGQRLPGDILELLAPHDLRVADIDLYGVAAGPGSFTGLRVGIATVQGLALVHGRQVVPICTLEALAHLALGGPVDIPTDEPIGVWMDAQRGEIFSALFRLCGRTPSRAAPEVAIARLATIDPAAVGSARTTAARWAGLLGDRPVWLAGEHPSFERGAAEAGLRVRPLAAPRRILAPIIGLLAEDRAAEGTAVGPHAIRPIYVRRSDAELARDRQRAEHEAGHEGRG